MRGEGALLDVRVERILPGGVGLAHAEGATLFVSLAAPGDLARVRVESIRGRAAFASIIEILNPSDVRVEPPCPYFGRCGGCDFQQLTYEAQLAAKGEAARDLKRFFSADVAQQITGAVAHGVAFGSLVLSHVGTLSFLSEVREVR